MHGRGSWESEVEALGIGGLHSVKVTNAWYHRKNDRAGRTPKLLAPVLMRHHSHWFEPEHEILFLDCCWLCVGFGCIRQPIRARQHKRDDLNGPYPTSFILRRSHRTRSLREITRVSICRIKSTASLPNPCSLHRQRTKRNWLELCLRFGRRPTTHTTEHARNEMRIHWLIYNTNIEFLLYTAYSICETTPHD